MVPHNSTNVHRVPFVHTNMTVLIHAMVTKPGPYPQGAWSPLGEQTTQPAVTTRCELQLWDGGRPAMSGHSGVFRNKVRLWGGGGTGQGNSWHVRVEGRQAQIPQGLGSCVEEVSGKPLNTSNHDGDVTLFVLLFGHSVGI